MHCLGFVFALILGSSVHAAEPIDAIAAPAATSAHVQSFSISEAQARASVQWLLDLALRKTDRTFRGDKDWGKTRKVWDGLKVHRDGLRLKTKRRWKEVKHGRWIRYDLHLPAKQPLAQQDSLVATVHRVTRVGELQIGEAAASNKDTHWLIDASVETPMTFRAKIQRWNLGIQLYSIEIEGDLRVRLDTRSTLTSYADYAEIPPALVIDPKVQAAHLDLKHFEVNKISRIGGDVAEEWGEMMESVFRELFLGRQNRKLVGQLNKSIDNSRDDLRLSPADWFAKW